eukprot:2329484-Amphidinium_carterae.1
MDGPVPAPTDQGNVPRMHWVDGTLLGIEADILMNPNAISTDVMHDRVNIYSLTTENANFVNYFQAMYVAGGSMMPHGAVRPTNWYNHAGHGGAPGRPPVGRPDPAEVKRQRRG